MQEMGHPDIADDLLYAGRERERQEMKRNHEDLMAIGLWFLKVTIGYGYGAARYFRTLYWVGGLTALGVAVLMLTGDYLLLDGSTHWSEATDRQQFMDLLLSARPFDATKALAVGLLTLLGLGGRWARWTGRTRRRSRHPNVHPSQSFSAVRQASRLRRL